MSADAHLDVSTLAFDEWLRFFFDRRLLAPAESFDEAFCGGGVLFRVAHPDRIVNCLTRMCRDFAEVGRRYSLPLLNQGIWAMFGPDFELQQNIWNRSVALEERLACLESMRIPYLEFVAGHPVHLMENAFEMWWHMVLASFWSRHPSPTDYSRLDADDRALLDRAFETLDAMLEPDDDRCQAYALHGLGHLHHPRVAARVQLFIDANISEITPDGLLWVEQCRDGTVM